MPQDALAVLLARPWLSLPLAWMAAARQVEPSSVSRIARGLLAGERPAAALRLVEASLVPFPADASLRRDRLRLLARLRGRFRLAAAAEGLAGAPDLDGETGHLLFSIASEAQAAGRPLGDGLAQAIRDRFAAAAPPLERARFARRDDRPGDALSCYRVALDEAPPPERPPVLREAARAMLAEDAWPDAIDLIATADAEGLLAPADPVRAHALAVASRNPRPLAPLPRLLFDDLAHLPPARTRPVGPVLMVGNSLRCGGMERVLAATVAGLAERGHDVRLALSDPPRAEPGSRFFLPASGLPEEAVLRLDRPPAAADPAVAAVPRRWRAEAAAIHAQVRALGPRLVHAWNDRLGLIAALAALPAGVPLVIHFHHMRPTRDAAEAASAAAYPDCLRRLLDRPDTRFVFCAEAAARDYADWLGVTMDERFVTVLNGFPDQPPPQPQERAGARRRFGLPAGARVVASLFRFEPVKQPLVWLEAAKRIADRVPDTHFLMPGDGELLPAVRARARELGFGGRVHLPGRIADTRAALAASDLLMMSSASEGLPNGAVEAQLAGVPVVAFDVGGMGETMEGGVSGRLVARDRPDLLADAAASWLADPDALAAAGRAARAFAGRTFAMKRYLDAIEAVYGSLA